MSAGQDMNSPAEEDGKQTDMGPAPPDHQPLAQKVNPLLGRYDFVSDRGDVTNVTDWMGVAEPCVRD